MIFEAILWPLFAWWKIIGFRPLQLARGLLAAANSLVTVSFLELTQPKNHLCSHDEEAYTVIASFELSLLVRRVSHPCIRFLAAG